MKTIPLVLTFAAFAAALAAQDPSAKPKPTPSQELAKIIAVEEQERDLAKAETLYRAAIAGGGLSEDAKVDAWMRLAGLCRRLGRSQDAAACIAEIRKLGHEVAFDNSDSPPRQDAEREKVLREKARALVAKVVEDAGQKGNQIGSGGIFGIDPPVAEQLLWIGEPAVPEVIAALETIAKTSGNGYSPAVVRSLAAFLWQTGGAKAEGFLRQAMADKAWMAGHYAEAACAATRPDMLAVVEHYLRSPTAGRSLAVLDGFHWGTPLKNRLDPGLLVEVLGRGSVAERQWLLTWALQAGDGKPARMPGGALQELVPVVRAALASAEPELGAAAQKLLQHAVYLQEHVAGLELLLERLPSSSVRISFGKWPRLDAAQATQLLPKCDAAFRALVSGGLDDPRLNWLHHVAQQVCAPLDARVVPQILAWIDLGGSWSLLLACEGKVDASNVADVVARFEKAPLVNLDAAVRLLDKVELAPALFAPLLARAEAWEAWQAGLAGDTPKPRAQWLAMTLARTGHAEAAPWLLARCSSGQSIDPWGKALIELGRHNREEPVRAALRTVLGKQHEKRRSAEMRAQLRLALLAMHDASMLAALAEAPDDAAVVSFHGDPGDSPIRPLDFLLHASPKPPHGFSEDEQLAFVRGMASWKSLPHTDHGRHASDRVLMAMVESTGVGVEHAAFRLHAEQGEGPWRRWLDRVIDQPGPARHIVTDLGPADLTRLRPRLEAALNGEDPRFAREVFAAFENSETMQPDFRAHLTNRHEEIRWRCFEMLPSFTDEELLRLLPTMTNPHFQEDIVRRLGDQLVVDAVPQLVALLKSPDSTVRDAAAQALTKIRFYHEQRAHWDRVLKGLDASPASAAEKLLLQGKPGAPKEQRLLAITSLGLLGAPEALPFLIEWTQDADADVAKKAKDAVTQIHLNPRR